jgi:PAP2 superfamily
MALECDAATFSRSKKFGEDIAQTIINYSYGDGQALAFANNKPTNFIAKIGPGLWRSTLPDTLRALTPLWGEVRPFALKAEDRTMKEPLVYSTDKKSDFYKQAKEVHDAVKNASKEDIWIAEYWSDDASTYTIDAAARWLSIANQAMKLKKTNLEQSVIITAKIGMVLHDASVACWGNKFKYNILRPHSFITENIDPAWKTLLRDPTKKVGQQTGVTPQHPSYPSGHSVFGQAAAEILIAELGDKINLTDHSSEKDTYYDRRPRTFKTFTAMAKENAYSRIALGVHYRMDCDEGLALGKKVGVRINAMPWRKAVL